MTKIFIISAIGSAVLLVVIVMLTLRRRIREQYALIWLAMGVLILIFSLFRGLLDLVARLAGIYYAPSLLIVLSVFLGMVLGIHFTVVLSRLTDSNKKLAQEVGLLKNRLERLERSRSPEEAAPAGPGA